MSVPVISPKQAREQYNPRASFPDCVVEALNALISKKVNESSSNATSFTLYQKEVFTTIDNAIKNYNQNKSQNEEELISQAKYRDIENLYRKEGWIVDVDWPGFNESYEGKWVFTFPKHI